MKSQKILNKIVRIFLFKVESDLWNFRIVKTQRTKWNKAARSGGKLNHRLRRFKFNVMIWRYKVNSDTLIFQALLWKAFLFISCCFSLFHFSWTVYIFFSRKHPGKVHSLMFCIKGAGLEKNSLAKVVGIFNKVKENKNLSPGTPGKH